MEANRITFLKFSKEITGCTSPDLEGTGLVDVYRTTVEGVIGPVLSYSFYVLASAVVTPNDPVQRENEMRTKTLPSPVFWPVVSSTISVWYLGT
jgi:hypothetical protein